MMALRKSRRHRWRRWRSVSTGARARDGHAVLFRFDAGSIRSLLMEKEFTLRTFEDRAYVDVNVRYNKVANVYGLNIQTSSFGV